MHKNNWILNNISSLHILSPAKKVVLKGIYKTLNLSQFDLGQNIQVGKKEKQTI